ncbi:protein FAM110A [Spinachia spinachia]
MPLETLQQPLRQPATNAGAAVPPRLRPKGPVGPDFYRQLKAAAGRPKQSAVERLEADKAKYVKSQVALSKPQPVARPTEARTPRPNPGAAMRPTRKTPSQAKTKPEEVPLNLEHLSNLISGVNDGAAAISEDVKALDAATAPGSACPTPAGASQKKERPRPAPRPAPRPDWSSPAKVRLKAAGPARVDSPLASGLPAARMVRRVDVVPQASPARTLCRPPQYIRQPLQPIPLHSQSPLRSAASRLRLFHTRTTPRPSPTLKPVVAPPKPDTSPAEGLGPAPSPPSFPLFPPASPAITRLSSSSSRKRPSLTRSKSDMSDRCSRAGTDLERFFNLCGLDPAELQLTGSNSDIVSMARFRSVSAPGSECAGTGGGGEEEEEGEEEEDASNAAQRVPYGVSVIERNARVIKWLYGLRQARDNAGKGTDL